MGSRTQMQSSGAGDGAVVVIIVYGAGYNAYYIIGLKRGLLSKFGNVSLS